MVSHGTLVKYYNSIFLLNIVLLLTIWDNSFQILLSIKCNLSNLECDKATF